MTIPRNPYVAGNPVGDSPAFIGRADVLREVLRVLRHDRQNAIVLYGQRRIGKTSILQHLASRLPEEGPYRPVYYDLQDKAAWPLGRLLQDMAWTIAHALDQPEPDLGPDPETAFRDEWLPALLEDLPEGSAVVLLLDEFDVLSDLKAEQAAAAFFPYLRGLLACDPGRLQFEFVIGRNVDDLSTIALSVFKGTPARHVSLLSQEDSAALVRLSEANNTLRWPEEAVERVWQWTHGHPFLTQQLCSHVWERAYEEASLYEEAGEPPTVAAAEVDAAVPEALDASKNTMEWLWDGLPPAARVVASALAEAGTSAISPEALERLLYDSGVRVVIRELQSAPELLQEWDLIEPTDGGYRFRVELLRRWIAESKPLRRVQEELDYIEPVAENLYQAALGLYQGGELEQAVGLLRQAIALNPNHVRANQLLADILLAQGEPGEAAQLLERLYEYQPAAARPRLVQALLAQAHEAATDDEKLVLYERVLAFNPSQPEATVGKRQIWEERGDAALEAGDLETALEAYEMGGVTGKIGKVAEEMNRRALAAEMQVLEKAEREGAYTQALSVAQMLAHRYPEHRDWTSDLERIEHKTQLRDLYQHALGALQSGDRQTAQTLLAQVVGLEPGYEEAARYLYLAVTGGEGTEPLDDREGRRGLGREAARRLDLERSSPWLALALIAINWVILGGMGVPIRDCVSEGERMIAMAIVGAYGGAITGLVLGLTLDWTRAIPRRVQLLGLGIFGVIVGAIVWAIAEGLSDNGAAQAGAIAMAVASAGLILYRLLAGRRRAEAGEVTAEGLALQRPLRPWNPLDHLRLLWWVLVTPQKLRAHTEALGQGDVRKVGKWLVSTLVWLPLFLTTLAVGLFAYWAPDLSLLATSFGVLVAWALTGRYGDRGGKWLVWVARVTAFAVGAWTLFCFVAILRNHLSAQDHIVMEIAIVLAAGVTLGIATVVVNGAAAGVAAGVLVGVAAGGVLASLSLLDAVDYLVASVVAGMLGFVLAFLVSHRSEASLETGRPSWLARGAFGLLSLCCALIIAFIVWFSFYEGW